MAQGSEGERILQHKVPYSTKYCALLSFPLSLRLVRELAERLHASEARYADIIGKDVPAQPGTLILTLVDLEGVVSSESYRIPTHYTNERLASMIGYKRVAVTRAFSRLKEIGAVELKERHIIVRDLDVLKGLAEAS